MQISVSQAISEIDDTGGHSPFILEFYKSDGSIRQMVAVKRNRAKVPTGQAREGSTFKYQLSERNMLLLDELVDYKTRPVQTPDGTLHELVDRPALLHLYHQQLRKRPVSVRIFSIRSFNGNQVYA